MKLWLLRPIKDDPRWDFPYDKVHGFVVRAENERDARLYAQAEGGDEVGRRDQYPAWSSAEHSTCVEVSAKGVPGIVVKDFNGA